MRDTARVVKIETNNAFKAGQKIWVVPLLTDTCINCNESSCAKRGKPFIVTNTKKLPLKLGSAVKIAASPKQQVFQALAAIGLPIAAAAAGFFAPFLFTENPSEALQICSLLSGFLLTALAVFALNRRSFAGNTAEITEIVSSAQPD